VRETDEDLRRLQRLLDDSYARAGGHLRGIHTARARIGAQELVARMPWMQVWVVATTSSQGRPYTGPVDGFLYRGTLWFGTSADALRARHLAARPGVSATHVRGEELVVTVHGAAQRVDLAEHAGFVAHLRDHYGEGAFDGWMADNPYYRVEADRVFAADMSVHQAG
jgi:hypothetical protein